jgi:proline iminopeptidase
LEANTTAHLVADIERLREMAGVDKWLVFGGSWGSTLSLAYAQAHTERVTELVLRGIFLFDQYEVDWLYKEGGASAVYPEQWDAFISLIPEDEHGDLVEAYRKRLTSEDPDEQLRAAKAWSAWEGSTVTLLPSKSTIENHYMANGGWFEEGELLRGAQKLRGIAGVIVQGRHDTCTPPKAAWALKKAWPEVDLQIVPDGGHLYNEPGILDGLIRATDRFANA